MDPKFRAIAQSMAAAIAGSRLALVPDAGHTIHLEQPAAFARLVLEFAGGGQ
jgi:pimeloyl-ACP methyl ester carboxylesterase